MKLLTVGNPKTLKGETQGYQTFILHLAPAKLSGYEMCGARSTGCTIACLNTAGRGGIFKAGEKTNTIQKARIRRTQYFVKQYDAFMSDLMSDILEACRIAAKNGLTPVFRLNGTSDVRWEDMPLALPNMWAPSIMAVFPTLQFYDYTKNLGRRVPANYHLTFSRSEINEASCRIALAAGMNVAVVFYSLPATGLYLGHPIIDGDSSDLRFRDNAGLRKPVIVGLKAKGRAKRDTTGFVVRQIAIS